MENLIVPKAPEKQAIQLNPTMGRLFLEIPVNTSGILGVSGKALAQTDLSKKNGLLVLAAHETSEIKAGDYVLINTPVDDKGRPQQGTFMTIDAKFVGLESGDISFKEIILTYEQFVEGYYATTV